MTPFPPLAKLPFFIGDEVAQIWLDPWGVRFLFASNAQLYAEYRIEHIDDDGTKWSYDCQAAKKAPVVFQRLLYQRIVSFDREELQVTFGFEDGVSLAVFSDVGPYEAGQFLTSTGILIVF